MKIISRNIKVFLLLVIALGITQDCVKSTKRSIIPPNKGAEIEFSNGKLLVSYNGNQIVKGRFSPEAGISFRTLYSKHKGAITQVLVFESQNNKEFTFHAQIEASRESFPCEIDRQVSGPVMVRHSSGLSNSLLNRAVYERKEDWVFSVDPGVKSKIIPAVHNENYNRYSLDIKGTKAVMRFRPRFYQRHRGLKYFKPWEYEVWDKSVAGWCSWFAFFRGITEDKIRHSADVVSKKLLPFGYTYLQMDDGYQQDGWGSADTWLSPNDKFPHGLDSLSRYIKSCGLNPGIWTYASFYNKDYVDNHRDFFVKDEKNRLARGRWVGWIMDASNKQMIDEVVKPVYKGLKDMGWTYFKVDGLRHLRYEGYNSYHNYFDKKGLKRGDVFREFAQSVRQTIGRDAFMLGCWGVRPELTGIIDGCRIGGDGFGYAGLAQYNSFNNVVWRNDPDHVELKGQDAYRSTMVTSLTGSVLMLTDKPEVYQTDRIEPARRAAPVLFTLPGQIYDVDPSRSMNLYLADAEVSGEGERPFDASRTTICDLFLLEINRSFEKWIVLGRMGERYKRIYFRDLGLDPKDEYIVFEFWTKRYLGNFKDYFIPGTISGKYGCQGFSIRRKQKHPQIAATNRHVSCGGVDLKNVRWENNSLFGISEIVANDPYTIYVTEVKGYDFKHFNCRGAKLVSIKSSGNMRIFTIVSEKSSNAAWNIEYRKI